MTGARGVARLRPDHRARRRSIDLEERLAASARHALVLAYLGFLVCGLLAPIAFALALRVRRDIRRSEAGNVWLGTTKVALVLSFGQVVVGGLLLLAWWLY